MILFTLIKFVLSIGVKLSNMLSSLGVPDITFSWIDDFIDSIDVVLYLIPLAKLEPLVIVILIVTNIRIASAIINHIIESFKL